VGWAEASFQEVAKNYRVELEKDRNYKKVLAFSNKDPQN
jgi:hypothetical protein